MRNNGNNDTKVKTVTEAWEEFFKEHSGILNPKSRRTGVGHFEKIPMVVSTWGHILKHRTGRNGGNGNTLGEGH